MESQAPSPLGFWFRRPQAGLAAAALLLAAVATAAPPAEVRTLDGSGNNLASPSLGSANSALLRMAPEAYGDSASAPAGVLRSGARHISNLVADQSGPIDNDAGLSDMFWQWGQFLDHDIDLTAGMVPEEALPIPVPTGDPHFDPFGSGTATIGFSRSLHDDGAPRQQINQISAFIDASNVYGSDQVRADELRTLAGDGRLKTSAGGCLPFNTAGLDNAGGPSPDLFLAGDVRANEQIGLTAMHTLFVREHNRLCDTIADDEPSLSGDEIYETARRIVGAEMQVITYQEFLPLLLGDGALPDYAGYDPALDAGIGNAFSTAAYRFGHSMLSDTLLRPRAPRPPSSSDSEAAENVPLKDSFFNPDLVVADGGIDTLLAGLIAQPAQALDTKLVDAVRNFLFGPPGAGGFDLAALNIQRGRDHGLADYNSARLALGLGAVASFAEVTSDPALRTALETAYADIDDVDLWVAGLAEDPLPGALVGETFHAILVDQFTRLRDGDRFWYQNDPFFSRRQRRRLERTSLADIIRRNTDVEGIGDQALLVGGGESDSDD